MEAVIFVGLQGSGKSTFYVHRFFRTHVRINLDMLRTRHRERLLLQACLEAQQRFVVDNTNPTVAQRAPYIAAAKSADFRVVGYYFRSRVAECLSRNALRPEAERVPDTAILGTAGQLQRPMLSEGFDELRYVWIDDAEGFVVEEWQDEV